jgi:hypothetical protein
MKRVLLASIIGMAAVASSYGQGQIIFDTYTSSQGQVLFTTDSSKLGGFSASLAGLPVGTEFNVALFAANGTGVSSTALMASTAIGTGYIGLGMTPVALSQLDGQSHAGYISGPTVVVTGYTPGSSASFLMEAWIGASYATSQFRGVSTVWTEPVGSMTQSGSDSPGVLHSGPWLDPLSPGDGVPGSAGNAGFYVESTIIPEPTTFALMGLGSAALLIFRRK